MVQRLLNTLVAHGFVEQSPQTRKYAIGYRAFMVGRGYVAASGIVDAALPVLRALVDETQLNAYVGEIRDDYALYLLVLQSRGPIAVRRHQASVRCFTPPQWERRCCSIWPLTPWSS